MIERVGRDFVPVAVNLYRLREAVDGSRELFESIQRQKDQYQGIWIVGPDGKVLAGRHDYDDFQNGAQELLATMDAGLAAFGRIKPRESGLTGTISATALTKFLPHRGLGTQADGSVHLALYVRQVLGGGRETKPRDVEDERTWLWDGPYRTDGPAVIDTVMLSAEEWRAFLPPRFDVGASWSVPEDVTRKFTRLMTASSDQSAMPRPEDAKEASIQCEIEKVTQDQVQIRLVGRWEMVHAIEGDPKRRILGTATASGTASYDRKSGALRSLRMHLDGIVRYGDAAVPANRIGAIAEWASQPLSAE